MKNELEMLKTNLQNPDNHADVIFVESIRKKRILVMTNLEKHMKLGVFNLCNIFGFDRTKQDLCHYLKLAAIISQKVYKIFSFDTDLWASIQVEMMYF